MRRVNLENSGESSSVRTAAVRSVDLGNPRGIPSATGRSVDLESSGEIPPVMRLDEMPSQLHKCSYVEKR